MILGFSKMWEGSLEPDPVRQGAEGALPGGSDHPEGLQVLQGPQEDPGQDQGQVLQRRARPGGGRVWPQQGGAGGLGHPELLPPLQAGQEPRPQYAVM